MQYNVAATILEVYGTGVLLALEAMRVMLCTVDATTAGGPQKFPAGTKAAKRLIHTHNFPASSGGRTMRHQTRSLQDKGEECRTIKARPYLSWHPRVSLTNHVENLQ